MSKGASSPRQGVGRLLRIEKAPPAGLLSAQRNPRTFRNLVRARKKTSGNKAWLYVKSNSVQPQMGAHVTSSVPARRQAAYRSRARQSRARHQLAHKNVGRPAVLGRRTVDTRHEWVRAVLPSRAQKPAMQGPCLPAGKDGLDYPRARLGPHAKTFCIAPRPVPARFLRARLCVIEKARAASPQWAR